MLGNLFVAAYLLVATVIDLPFFIAGRLWGIGPDKAFHEQKGGR